MSRSRVHVWIEMTSAVLLMAGIVTAPLALLKAASGDYDALQEMAIFAVVGLLAGYSGLRWTNSTFLERRR